jgi:uncharacterized protein (TIGR03435 family)
VRTVALLVIAAAAAHAQPAFEVASIREHIGPISAMMDYSVSGPRLTLGAYGPAALVREAYNLERHELVFPPALAKANETYYNIAAKAPGNDPVSRDDFRRMLQTLLAERFHLAFHREPKEMPVYALVVAKGGPKFKPSAPDAKRHFLGSVNKRNQVITATRYTVADLALHLGFIGADRPIIDQTGLTGEYDFRVEATPIRQTAEPDDLSIFTAVQEQLGLRLEPRRAPVEVLVVDRFEKPSAN